MWRSATGGGATAGIVVATMRGVGAVMDAVAGSAGVPGVMQQGCIFIASRPGAGLRQQS